MKKKNILIIIALILTLVLGYLIVSVIIDNNKRYKELQEYQNKLITLLADSIEKYYQK